MNYKNVDIIGILLNVVAANQENHETFLFFKTQINNINKLILFFKENQNWFLQNVYNSVIEFPILNYFFLFFRIFFLGFSFLS